MLSFLQIAAMVLIGILNIEAVLWAVYTDKITVLMIIIPSILTYVGLLARLFFGEMDNLVSKAFVRLWNCLLSEVKRATGTVFACLTMVIVLGILDFKSSFVPMSALVVEDGRPATGIFDIRVAPVGSVASYHQSNNLISMKVRRGYLNSTLLVSAHNSESETPEPAEVKVSRDATFRVNVAPKATLYVGRFVSDGKLVGGPFVVTLNASGRPTRRLTATGKEVELKLSQSELPFFIVAESDKYRTAEPVRVDKQNTQFLIPVLSTVAPGVEIAKLSAIPDEGFRQGRLGKLLMFAQDPTRDSRALYLKTVLKTNSQTPKYVKHASLKVTSYETLKPVDGAERFYVASFQVVFASVPAEEQIADLCKHYSVRVRNKLDEIVTFEAKGDFFESDLQRLRIEPNVQQASVLSYGTAYSTLPFRKISSTSPISPHGPPVGYDLDEKVSATDLDGVVLEVRFADTGRYLMELEVGYDGGSVRSDPFLVFIAR